ncbi:retrovirus-related pol polyprotein from transposon TNT 1-94 [Tanacetum coccineum]
MQETVSKFFHIFVLFATSVRDGENLDKMKKKVMVLCIFCGYLLSQRLTGSDPAPQCPTTVLEHDSLSPGPQSQENVPQVDETVTTSTFPLKLFNKSYFPTKVPMSVAPENIIQAETNSRTIRLARIRWRDVYVALSQLYQFDRLDVWELVDMPLCKNVINLKWLWKNKRDEENTVIRNKSRLVAKGYAQKEGIDFERVIFAPVFRVRSCTVSSLEKKCTYTKTDGFCSGPYHPEKFLVSRKHYIGIKQAPRACMMNSPTSWDSDSSIPRGIFINQAKYAQEILKKHGMTSCDSIGTPMATKNTLDADLSGTLVDQTKYRSMVGALMYLTARSPGSNYTFSEIRIHARCLDSRKSTSGGIQILGGDSYQVLWLRTQLTDYGFHFDKIPMYCDSKAAIAISCNPVQHSYTKHIDGRMPTKIELTLEQSQQGVSNDVLILRFEAGNPVRDSLNLHDSHGIVFILLKGETRGKSIGQTQTVKMMQQVQGMIKMIDDADIRPIYDEEPMAKGRVDQYPETCQVKSPMLDSSPDNQTTEYSKQSLESKTTEQTTSLLANNAELKAQIQEKVFAIAALKNDLRKLKGNSVDTKFDKTSVLGKPVLPSLRNQSVVRQPHAFKSAWAQMSKQRYINQCLEGTTSIDYVQNTIVKVDSPDDATDIMMSVHNSSGSSQCQNVV